MSSTIQALFNASQSPTAIEGAKGTSRVQRPESETQDSSQKPVVDEYIPKEKREPGGRYWLEKGEDGQPKVYFDDPERADAASENEYPNADSPEQNQGADGPDKRVDGKQAETCTASTDKIDQEIEKLKKKREELERQIRSEADEAKIKALEQELSQVERELSQKDNDAYRRQHTVFS